MSTTRSNASLVKYLDEVLGVRWVSTYVEQVQTLPIVLVDVTGDRTYSETLAKLAERLGQALVDEWTRVWMQNRSDAFPLTVACEWCDLDASAELLSSNSDDAAILVLPIVVFGSPDLNPKTARAQVLHLPRLSEIASSTESKRKSWLQMQTYVETQVQTWIQHQSTVGL